MVKVTHANTNQKEAGIPTLTFLKKHFKPKKHD